MLIDYTFTKYKDVYKVNNLSTLSLLSVEVKDENGNSILQHSLGTQAVYDLPKYSDGKYTVILSRVSGDTITININILFQLQKHLLLNFKNAICQSLCCTNSSVIPTFQTLFNQLTQYAYFLRSDLTPYCNSNCIFEKFLYDSFQSQKDLLIDLSNKQIKSQLYYAKDNPDDESFKYIVAIYYSAFFLMEKVLAINANEIKYVEEKFYWNTVSKCIRKSIVCLEDIEDIFAQAVSDCGVAPTVNSVSISFGNNTNTINYSFQAIDFTTGFFDQGGLQPKFVKLLANAYQGQFLFDGVAINTENFIFDIADVNKLVYQATITGNKINFNTIYFQVSNNNTIPVYSNMATVTLNTTQFVNQPPSVVGDNTFVLANRQTKVFTLADFTTQTVPAYQDPENDPVDALRIDSLPATGQLILGTIPCTLNQVIPASQIIAGNFKYVAPDQNGTASANFNFSLRDSGSLTFAS